MRQTAASRHSTAIRSFSARPGDFANGPYDDLCLDRALLGSDEHLGISSPARAAPVLNRALLRCRRAAGQRTHFFQGLTMHRPPGWSSEKKLWSELRKLGREMKWTKVAFDLNCADLLPERSGGVYLICAAAPQQVVTAVRPYTILYVGKVTRRGLRFRFREHVAKPNRKLGQFVDCYYPDIHFWFSVSPDSSRIGPMESLLKETFNPPCNSISPPGTRALLARIGAGVPITAGWQDRHT